jgi:hypothetical protein
MRLARWITLGICGEDEIKYYAKDLHTRNTQ